MDYLLCIAIVIVLCVATFLILIFIPKHKVFYSTDICKELENLSDKEYFIKLKEELTKFNEKHPSTDEIVLLYDGVNVHNDMHECMFTYELLRTVPCLTKCYLRTVKNKTKSKKKNGGVESNNVLECILPINISAAKKSSLWNDGETKFFDDGTWIIHDSSREHLYQNKHKRINTLLLILHIDRPESIPKGIA